MEEKRKKILGGKEAVTCFYMSVAAVRLKLMWMHVCYGLGFSFVGVFTRSASSECALASLVFSFWGKLRGVDVSLLFLSACYTHSALRIPHLVLPHGIIRSRRCNHKVAELAVNPSCCSSCVGMWVCFFLFEHRPH